MRTRYLFGARMILALLALVLTLLAGLGKDVPLWVPVLVLCVATMIPTSEDVAP